MQDSKRILVGIQVPDPKYRGIALDAGNGARLAPVSGREATGGFRDFIQLRVRMYKASPGEGSRLP